MEFDKLRILVVEDNVAMRRLINTILRQVHVKEVMEAANGAEAAKILESGWIPDVVLSDYVMDLMDGIELTRYIRTRIDTPESRLPVIIVTGYADVARLHAARDAGATDFVAKPFTTKTLTQKIQRVLRNGATLKELMDARAAASAAS